jgi:hypothetical protein
MLEQSVLRTSGQWSKTVFFFVALFAGAGAVTLAVQLIGESRPNEMPASYVFWLLGTGFLVWGFALLFGVTAIGCRACGVRWLWAGASGKLGRDWINDLLHKPDCPSCGAVNGREKAT